MDRKWAPILGLVALVLSVLIPATPAVAQYWQCVGYAREASGIEIRGDAHTWWGQAEGRYARGQAPRDGAVMAFRSSGAMPLGHVAVVSRILSDREVLLDHANWSRGGKIERGVRAIDVSAAGDWSQVKVWFGPIGDLGKRVNPVAGFIYTDESPMPTIARASSPALGPALGPARGLLSRDVIQLAALELASGR